MKRRISGRGKAIVVGVLLLAAITCPAVATPVDLDIYSDMTIGAGVKN